MFRAALIALALFSLNCDMVVDEEMDGENNSSSSNNDSNDEDSSNEDDDEETTSSSGNSDDEESTSSSGDACETCVGTAVKGACKNAVTECNESDACNELGACLEKCDGDKTCINKCGEDHGDGRDLYIAANDCIFCGECQEDCEVPADACGSSSSGGSDSSGSGGSSGSSADLKSCTSDGTCGQDAFCVQVEQGQAGYCSPMCNPSSSDCPDGFECKGDAQEGFACVALCTSTAECPTGWECHQSGICMP